MFSFQIDCNTTLLSYLYICASEYFMLAIIIGIP